MGVVRSIGEAGALGRLAAALGVSTSWTDDRGVEHVVSEDTLLAVISAAMEEPITTKADVSEALAAVERNARDEVIPNVIVAEEGWLPRLELDEAPEGAVLLGEDGSTLAGTVSECSVGVDDRLDAGLYTLTVGTRHGHRIATVVATPPASAMTAPPPLAIRTNVAELRDRPGADQGLGHAGLLGRLAETLSHQGIEVVSTESLLPHREVDGVRHPGVMSRRGWAEWIVDVESAPGAASLNFDWRATSSGTGDATAARRAALTRYAELVGDHPALRAELDRFLVRKGYAARYARFMALGETLSEDWRRWPAPWRSGDIANAPADESRELYHQVVQWLADRQLHAVIDEMSSRGQLLEMSLDIRVHPHGFDYWNQPHIFSSRASVGRPETTRGPAVDFGCPVARPSVAHRDGFRSFASAVRHQLVGGLLHIPGGIDAFHRAWWIPAGAEPQEGTYVHQDARELLAVVRLEAHRLNATVVSSGPQRDTSLPYESPRLVALSDIVGEAMAEGRMRRPLEHVLADADVLQRFSAESGGGSSG